MLKKIYPFKFNKNAMKTLKPLLIALALSSTTFTTVQAAESNTTNHQAQKQVPGYYHHQIDNTQITALLDGTNYLNLL